MLKWFDYLADGIYPKLRFLMSTIVAPVTRKEQFHYVQQEGARKMIDRLFGVFFKKYQILYRPYRLWFVDDMNNVVRACAILHKMDLTEKKKDFTGTRFTPLADDSDKLSLSSLNVLGVNELPTVHAPTDPQQAYIFWQAYTDGIEGKAQYF